MRAPLKYLLICSVISKCLYDFCLAQTSKDDYLEGNAHYQYMMFCQGCHGQNGEGATNRVPKLQGFIGIFTWSQEGRAYLARVPGVIAPNLSDQDTAALLNWMVTKFAQPHQDHSFLAFSADEIKKIGRNPILDTNFMRLSIIKNALPHIPSHIKNMADFKEWSQFYY